MELKHKFFIFSYLHCCGFRDLCETITFLVGKLSVFPVEVGIPFMTQLPVSGHRSDGLEVVGCGSPVYSLCFLQQEAAGRAAQSELIQLPLPSALG